MPRTLNMCADHHLHQAAAGGVRCAVLPVRRADSVGPRSQLRAPRHAAQRHARRGAGEGRSAPAHGRERREQGELTAPTGGAEPIGALTRARTAPRVCCRCAARTRAVSSKVASAPRAFHCEWAHAGVCRDRPWPAGSAVIAVRLLWKLTEPATNRHAAVFRDALGHLVRLRQSRGGAGLGWTSVPLTAHACGQPDVVFTSLNLAKHMAHAEHGQPEHLVVVFGLVHAIQAGTPAPAALQLTRAQEAGVKTSVSRLLESPANVNAYAAWLSQRDAAADEAEEVGGLLAQEPRWLHTRPTAAAAGGSRPRRRRSRRGHHLGRRQGRASAGRAAWRGPLTRAGQTARDGL
jgi:hypothetical protein